MRVLLALLCLAPAPAAQRDFLRPGAEVGVETIEGLPRFTVRVQESSALSLVRDLARLSERDLVGAHHLSRPALVTADLHQRRLDQVLEYVLGSLGLRHRLGPTTIEILGAEAEGADELFDRASVAWLSAYSRFPGHPLAAHARLSQGEIEEKRGRLSAARSLYLSLTEDYPLAHETGEAYMRAGRLSARLGQWAEAGRLFKDLARLEAASELHAAARLEWARATIHQGDPRQALYILAALDTNYPATDRTEATARRLVRARAHNGLEQYMDALREIDQSDGDFDEVGAWEALRVRAVALAGIGLPGEAARAWLLYAEEASGPEQALAYSESARLSLEADDELGVLFVAQAAQEAGLAAELEPYVREARQRLGLEEDALRTNLVQRVDQLESWVERGRFDLASATLQELFVARGGFPEPLLGPRVSVAWARCVDHTSGLEAAIEVLAEVRPNHTDPEELRILDIGAARLFEEHERFDEAVGAYQGEYAKP